MLLAIALSVAIASDSASQPHDDHADAKVGELQDSGGIMDILAEQDQLTVFAASKEEETMLRSPANTVIVTHEQIVERGYRFLMDVLADMPGMETIPNSFSEYGTQVPVRGIVGNNEILLLVNGMRVNPPGGEDLMMRNDEDVRYAKRIEIVYGPGSALYGADAVNLIVNIVTADPDEAKAYNLNASYGLGYGLNNTGEFSGSAGHRFANGIGINAFAHFYDSQETPLDKAYPQWFTPRLQAWQAAGEPEGKPAYRWNEGLNTFLQFSDGGFNLQYWFRWSNRPSGLAYDPFLVFSDKARWTDYSNVVRASYDTKLASNVDSHTWLTYNSYTIDPSSRYVWPLGNDLYNYRDDKYGRGTSAELESFVTWSHKDWLKVTGGAWVADYEVVPKATVAGSFNPAGDLVSQNGAFVYYLSSADAQAGKNPQSVAQLQEFHYQRGALYVNARLSPLAWLDIVGGVRADFDSRYVPVVNPRASIIARPIKSLSIKYVFGMSYVAPAPYFQYATFENSAQINEPNHALQPERAISNELAVAYEDRRLTINAGVYVNHQDNLWITGDGAIPAAVVNPQIYVAGSTTPIALTQNVNLGQEWTYGADGMAVYKYYKKSSAFLTLSFTQAQTKQGVVTTGLTGASAFNLRLGSTFYILDNLWITPRFTYRTNPQLGNGQAVYQNTTTYGNPQAKNIYEIDLFANYQVIPQLGIYLRGTNFSHAAIVLQGTGDGFVPIDLVKVELGLNFTP